MKWNLSSTLECCDSHIKTDLASQERANHWQIKTFYLDSDVLKAAVPRTPVVLRYLNPSLRRSAETLLRQFQSTSAITPRSTSPEDLTL